MIHIVKRLGLGLGTGIGEWKNGKIGKWEIESTPVPGDDSIVKLRSGSRSGEGQVRVRRVRFGPELYPIFGFHPPPPTQTFFKL